jgi:hypothetical protein
LHVETRGRKSIVDLFPGILPALEKYKTACCAAAQERRRDSTEQLSSSSGEAEGFTLEGARHHLYDNIPGLYEEGICLRTIHHMFQPPLRKSREAHRYKGFIDARVGKKSNNFRKNTEATHYGRSQQKMMFELFALFGQPNFSGDDMNIIQVGRMAVSRYHQTRRFFTTGLGLDAPTHDFPVAELGIKMGGFMLLGGDPTQRKRASSF